jgi:Domain of unknown function (DUF4037)
MGDDPVLAVLIQGAAADPDTIGLVLSGSRAVGQETAESDYDLYWALSAPAHAARLSQGAPLHERRQAPGQPHLDIVYVCQEDLDRQATAFGWWTYGYSTARVLLDKTGTIAPAIQALALMPEEKAQADAAGWFDAYLNAFYRSLKCWRRGDELGARLEAADSAMHLVRTLFSLERRWTPYPGRLDAQLALLDGQGWPPGYLRERLLDLVMTGEPHRQIELQSRVQALLEARGYGHVLNNWGGEIERVKALYEA